MEFFLFPQSNLGNNEPSLVNLLIFPLNLSRNGNFITFIYNIYTILLFRNYPIYIKDINNSNLSDLKTKKL